MAGGGMAVDVRLDNGAELSVLGPDHARALAVRLRASGRHVHGIGGSARTIGCGHFDIAIYPGHGAYSGGYAPGHRPAG